MKAAASSQVSKTAFCTAVIIQHAQVFQKIRKGLLHFQMIWMERYCFSRHESVTQWLIILWQAWFIFLILRNNDFPFRLSENAKAFSWFSGFSLPAWMIIALQKTVLNTWKLAAAFILFSLNSLHGHRLFPDAWWSGAVKSRWSPGDVVVWIYCCRQQQHWKRHLSSTQINTNKDDEVHALMRDDSAYW